MRRSISASISSWLSDPRRVVVCDHAITIGVYVIGSQCVEQKTLVKAPCCRISPRANACLSSRMSGGVSSDRDAVPKSRLMRVV